MSDFETKRMKAEEIVREHADMIYRIALQNVKNPDDASDIFQEVCPLSASILKDFSNTF